jgi:hypothetical protein
MDEDAEPSVEPTASTPAPNTPQQQQVDLPTVLVRKILACVAPDRHYVFL